MIAKKKETLVRRVFFYYFELSKIFVVVSCGNGVGELNLISGGGRGAQNGS